MTTPPRPDSEQTSRDLDNFRPHDSRRRSLWIHSALFLTALVILFGALVVWMIGIFTGRPVTLVIEGTRREVRTHQTTVGEVLAEVALWIEPEDRIDPAPDTPLSDNLAIRVDKAHPVLIEADGDRRRILTHHTQVADILSEAGIELEAMDRLFVDGTPELIDSSVIPRSIRVARARPVTLREGDKTSRVRTAAATVGGVLSEAKIALVVADQVNPPLSTPIQAEMTITIIRALSLTIEVDGRVLHSRAAAFSVGEALAQTGIALIGMDYTVPAEETVLTEGMMVQVVRVTEVDEIERAEIEFQTLTQTVDTLPANETRVLQEGIKGIREMRVRVRLEDGVEVSRSTPREMIVRPPREEIIAIGATPSLYQTATPQPNSP